MHMHTIYYGNCTEVLFRVIFRLLISPFLFSMDTMLSFHGKRHFAVPEPEIVIERSLGMIDFTD